MLIVSPTLIIVTTSIELNEVSHKTAQPLRLNMFYFSALEAGVNLNLLKLSTNSSQSSVNFLPSLNVCEVKFNAVYHHVGLDTRGEEVCCPRRCPRLQEVYRPGREQRE